MCKVTMTKDHPKYVENRKKYQCHCAGFACRIRVTDLHGVRVNSKNFDAKMPDNSPGRRTHVPESGRKNVYHSGAKMSNVEKRSRVPAAQDEHSFCNICSTRGTKPTYERKPEARIN